MLATKARECSFLNKIHFTRQKIIFVLENEVYCSPNINNTYHDPDFQQMDSDS
jgi:hypothetical protein